MRLFSLLMVNCLVLSTSEEYLSNEHDYLSKLNSSSSVQTHELFMPGVAPQQPDTYLCYAMKMPDADSYITKFEPKATMKVVHHMVLFGCEEPNYTDKFWKCNEMKPVCKKGKQLIEYAWGKNAPSLELPKNVGFHVGGSSNIKYLVVEVHYLHVDIFKDGKTKDHSGLVFTTTTEKPKYFASVYLLKAGWPPIPPHIASIPAQKEKFHMDMRCLYKSDQNIKIHPFRFRVHTHSIGAVVTTYRFRNGQTKLIGRGDPQRAQAFYKVDNEMDIKNGDTLIGRCTFNSTSRNRITYIGPTHNDEMCAFYNMVFYDSKFGDYEPSCLPSDESIDYPADSDVTLAEMERKGSLYLHDDRKTENEDDVLPQYDELSEIN